MKTLSVLFSFLLFLSCNSFASDKTAYEFVKFVELSSRIEKSDDKEFVWTWPKKFKSCVFGDYNQKDKSSFENDVNLISEIADINITNVYRGGVQECPDDTLLYFRFHSKGVNTKQLILDDIHSVDENKGRISSTSTSSLSDMGGIFYSYGGDLSPYIFISAINSGETLFLGQNEVAEELLQKSLFLVITAIPDQLKLREFPSFLHDPVSSITDERNAIFDIGKRRTNMCLFDVMLLRAQYQHSDTAQSLSQLLDNTRKNYTTIKKFSEEIYYNSLYRNTLPKKC
ncbi:hypothetical protein [Brucella pituitosa]|uniref:hypothetical protein n=1 Tax=Brucella pituitosa TaxID=571256 RepID=UPI0012603C97|nr:hypothetical protein [Brucella pituitosa]